MYNAEQSIRRMLKCLVMQTEKNFEVLLIDDGSMDETKSVCWKVIKDDFRFKYFYQENSGVSAARNKGIRIAKGEYITVLDADDYIDKNYLKVLREYIEKYNTDIAICDVVVLNKELEIKRFTHQNEVCNREEALNLLLERKTVNSGPCAKLFKKEILQNNTFPSLKAYEDILFVKEALNKCKKVVLTNQTAYYYVQNNAGVMSGFNKMPTTDILVATEALLKFICGHCELSAESLYVTVSHLMQYVQPLLSNDDQESCLFVEKSRKLYKKYLINIVCCKAFPWKEKIAYILFCFGWDMWNKKRV